MVNLELLEHHYSIPGKDQNRGIGLAIDACVKELVLPLGAIISQRYDPHDYLLDGVYHEIKSSADGRWLSIPNTEIEFARENDTLFDIVLQVDMRRCRFLGSMRYSKFRHLIEPSKFVCSRLTEIGWISERSYRVPFKRIGQLLT